MTLFWFIVCSFAFFTSCFIVISVMFLAVWLEDQKYFSVDDDPCAELMRREVIRELEYRFG